MKNQYYQNLSTGAYVLGKDAVSVAGPENLLAGATAELHSATEPVFAGTYFNKNKPPAFDNENVRLC